MAIDPELDQQLRDYRVTSGRFLIEDSDRPEIVLVDSFAADQSIQVGQVINILTAYGQSELTVVGLIANEGAGLNNLGKFGVISLAVAQEMARRPTRLTRST